MVRERVRTSRRQFCSLSMGVLLLPRTAAAQTSKVRRIGTLEAGPVYEWIAAGRAEALRKIGWVEGRNLQFERRYYFGQSESPQAIAEQLLRASVEIIVTTGPVATLAAKRATTTVPIVFDSTSDPVLLGVVSSLARPGGNVTGYSIALPEVTSKNLSLLKEVLPGLQRIGVLQAVGNPYKTVMRSRLEQDCEALGLVPTIVETESGDKIVVAIEELARGNVQVVMFDDSVGEADIVVNSAMKHGLPTLALDHAVVREQGALIAYSSTWSELWSRRAEYIDRVLRGAWPGDLPVQQPSRFELAINLKTARKLGLTIPQSVLSRADVIVE